MAGDLFKEPEKVLRWARDEFDELSEAGAAFLETNPYVVVEEVDPVTYDFLIKLRILKPTPDKFEKGTYRVLGDLRNALDQACHAASVALGSNNPDKTNFPMARSLKDLETQLASKKGVYRGIPSSLHPKLIEFKPFWAEPDDGNNLLRSLGDMANPNKHRVPVRSGLEPEGLGIRELIGIERVEVLFEWNALKSELTVARMQRAAFGPSRYSVNLKIVQAFADGPLKGRAVTTILREMFPMIETTINQLSAEVDRIRSLG